VPGTVTCQDRQSPDPHGDGDVLYEHACKLGLEGHRLEAAGLALRVRQYRAVAEGEQPAEPGGAEISRSRRMTACRSVATIFYKFFRV
jgi:hypothetical protein